MTETQIFWIVLSSVIILIASIPFVRFFIKRIILVNKLKQFCKKNSYNLHKAGLFWWLGRRGGVNCDFYLEDRDNIYSVKLFGVPKRSYMLIFTEGGKYFFRKILVIRGKAYNNDGKLKNMRPYNFRYKFNPEWELKNHHNILLVHPVCFEIHNRKKNGIEKLIGTSDMINGMSVYSLARLIGHLGANKQ